MWIKNFFIVAFKWDGLCLRALHLKEKFLDIWSDMQCKKIALFSNDFQVEENTSLPAYESSSDRIKKKKTFCLSFVSQILDASLLHTAPQQKE